MNKFVLGLIPKFMKNKRIILTLRHKSLFHYFHDQLTDQPCEMALFYPYPSPHGTSSVQQRMC